jgi:predicted phosphoadenosine phosphosulfate sulfurtransferase
MRDRIDKYIKEWMLRGYLDNIPDEVPDALMDESLAPSYKAIAIAILRNDHHMTALGFQAPKSIWYNALKRIEINQRNKQP